MKKIFEVALGIVTSIGGFLEIGSISTAAQAGAEYRYSLLWTLALGTLCLIFLIEMSGRLAAVSKKTITDAVRERFGFSFFVFPLVGIGVVTFLVLASEIGGMSIALELATGVSLRWWAFPVAFVAWLLLWKGTFGVIEKGTSLLGLVTLAFLVAMVKMHPAWRDVGAGLLPTRPSHDAARYWFLAVSVLGASITPYLFIFYSSGAVEDKWTVSDLWVNRATATLGMTFGGGLSIAVLIVAAAVFHVRGIHVDSNSQLALILTPALGWWGFVLFVASLGISCFGATLEIALALAYQCAQGLGWTWGESRRPREAARFATVYTVALIAAAVVIAAGVDPLQLTILTMALTAASLPLLIVPFLLIMNDKILLGDHTNGIVSNAVVIFTVALAFVLAIVAIPLQFLGGG